MPKRIIGLFVTVLGSTLLFSTEGCRSTVSPTLANYQSVWINAEWSGGRTGTALHLTAVEPPHWTGSLCHANTVHLYNHLAGPNNADIDSLFEIQNLCSVPIDFLMCGIGSSQLDRCAQDPRETPFSSLRAAHVASGERKAVLVTGINLAISLFYCSSQSAFAIGVASVPATNCLQ